MQRLSHVHADLMQLEITAYGCLDHFLEGDTYRA